MLEHSAPEPLVAPAYRLCTGSGVGADGGADAAAAEEPSAPVLTVVGADRLPRPALAFLGRDDEEGGGRALAAPVVPVPVPVPVPTPGRSRYLVRRRRRDTLGMLVALFVVTLLLGFLPGAAAAWVVCAVSGVALAGYVALLVRLRKLAEERGRKLRYLGNHGRSSVRGRGVAEDALVGRFAHPSHQVWATR